MHAHALAHAHRKQVGRLKVCSHSVVFDPEDIRQPILRLPLRNVARIGKYERGPLLDAAPTGELLMVQAGETIKMKVNNCDAPYVFEKVRSLVVLSFCLFFCCDAKKKNYCHVRSAARDVGRSNTLFRAQVRAGRRRAHRDTRVYCDFQGGSRRVARRQTTFDARSHGCVGVVRQGARRERSRDTAARAFLCENEFQCCFVCLYILLFVQKEIETFYFYIYCFCRQLKHRSSHHAARRRARPRHDFRRAHLLRSAQSRQRRRFRRSLCEFSLVFFCFPKKIR